jgi:hypothetical protein
VLVKTIHSLGDYLASSKKELFMTIILKNIKKLTCTMKNYIESLNKFIKMREFFWKWRNHIALNAQIQILLELDKAFIGGLLLESENQLINMILHEKIHFIGKLPEETWTNNQDGEDLFKGRTMKIALV